MGKAITRKFGEAASDETGSDVGIGFDNRYELTRTDGVLTSIWISDNEHGSYWVEIWVTGTFSTFRALKTTDMSKAEKMCAKLIKLIEEEM